MKIYDGTTFVNDMSDCFMKSDKFSNIGRILSQILCYSQCNSYRYNLVLSLICIINILSITFLCLANQQDSIMTWSI